MTNVTNLTLNPEHRAQLDGLAALLTTWNKAHNLVSRKLQTGQLLDLLREATAFERFLPQTAYIADLGSGAGIPLPLAIIRPDLKLRRLNPVKNAAHGSALRKQSSTAHSVLTETLGAIVVSF